MSARAGVVVTGTEVLTGIIADKNGPWLSERLCELGIDHAHTVIVGDRPEDVRAALDFFARAGMDLVVTSGGLGPDRGRPDRAGGGGLHRPRVRRSTRRSRGGSRRSSSG